MTDLEGVVGALADSALAGSLRRAAPLGELTTYRVGGVAAALVTIETEDQLLTLSQCVGGTGVPTLSVGRGSNLLVSDAGFDGIVVVLGGGFDDIEVNGTTVTAGASAKLPVAARTTVQAGLRGFEWAVGVPGSIGGAVRMNAGGHGADMSVVVIDVDVLDLASGERRWRDRSELAFGYRTSAIAPTDVVIAARLALEPGDAAAGKAAMLEVVQWRREHQPGGQNAGSVFTNPADDSAGRLIDSAGLKGLRIGTAEVSDKHANFIQADPGGRAGDVLALMNEIVRRVYETHGIVLHRETVLVGFGRDEEVVPGA